jgi:hypothetical protein
MATGGKNGTEEQYEKTRIRWLCENRCEFGEHPNSFGGYNVHRAVLGRAIGLVW